MGYSRLANPGSGLYNPFKIKKRGLKYRLNEGIRSFSLP